MIIELKRGEHKLQLLQALSYASMIADLEPDQFKALMSSGRRALFDEFTTENSIESLNLHQRILLIAEHYDYTVLSTAKWLTEFYGMNISCYQISLAQDAANSFEYLSAVQIFPPKQLADQARQRGALRSEESSKFDTIEDLLKTCSNPVVKSFFAKQIAVPGIRKNKRSDSLVYPELGKIRFLVQPRPKAARVMQWGRFDGDKQLWTERLSAADVRDRGHELRFYLSTESDFVMFAAFIENDISRQNWGKSDHLEENPLT